jgi:ABC-2 type transport system permease protein
MHDRALFVGLGLGFGVSLLPMLFLFGGRSFRSVLTALLQADVFVLSPFAWPVRAAVHASRGELLAALGWAGAGLLALGIVLGLNALVARRLYEGEVAIGPAPLEAADRRRLFRLPGEIGALVEKDLRLYWRDPRLKAMLFTSLLSPIILFLLWRGASDRPATGFLVFLAAFSGLSALGGNAFALERRGLLLLFSLPMDRFDVLVGKNLAAMALRLPSLLALAVMAALLAPGGLLLPLAATTVIALFLGAATDNFLSILCPVPVPDPGGNPMGPASGGRGLGAALAAAMLMTAALALSAPFVFLAFLPVLLELPLLFAGSVPLAVAGAVSVYLLLVAAAARILRRREPEVLARVLAEE